MSSNPTSRMVVGPLERPDDPCGVRCSTSGVTSAIEKFQRRKASRAKRLAFDNWSGAQKHRQQKSFFV